MYIDKMIDLQNVVQGQVAVLKLAYAATFDKVHFFLTGGLTKANIHQIEGKVNGVQFFVDDGALVGVREAYLGNFVDATVLTLDFTEPNARGGAPQQYLASLPKNLVQSLTFELTLDAAAGAGIGIQALAEYRDPTANKFILRRKKFTPPLPNVGENDVLMPVGIGGGMIKRIWVHHAGQVTNVELRANGKPRLRASDPQLQYAQKRNKLVPQANTTVLDFVADGNLMGMLNTAGLQETLIRFTTNAAGSATVFVDYIDPLDNLH